MTNLSYSNITELKEVETVEEANSLLKGDWFFLKHYQIWSVKLGESGGQITEDRFLLGRNGYGPDIRLESSGIRPSPRVSRPDILRNVIASQEWKDGKWCWAVESNGKKRPEVLDLTAAIDESPQGKLLLDGYEYTLSPKESKGKYPPKSFIRRQRVESGV